MTGTSRETASSRKKRDVILITLAGFALVALLVAANGIVLGAVLWRVLPAAALIAMLTLPLSYRAMRGATRFYGNTQQLIPTNAATIQLHLSTGLLLCLGYVISGIAGRLGG